MAQSGGKWWRVPPRGETMFIGEYQHTIDNKGRLIMPSRFREGLGERFIITKGLDECLFVYSLEEWNNLEAKLKTLPFTNKDVRAFVRFFFSGAAECELDKQGRVLIPANLREFAKLDKEVVITGVSTRIEIWSKEKWEKYNSESGMDADAIAEKMSLLGI